MEFTDSEMKTASIVSRKIHSLQRRLVDYDDIQSECYVWLCKNPERVKRWREEGKQGRGKLSTALYRAGMRYAVRERARITRTHVADHAFYSEALLHEILPDIFDYEDWALASFADDSDGRSSLRPGEGNTRLAMICDVRFAYDLLGDNEKNILKDRFADGGLDVQVMAATYQVSESTMRRRIRAALRKLTDRLGGEPPWL